jgi:hypothetical protein
VGRMLAVSTSVAAVLWLGGCADMNGFDQAREDFHYSYPLQPGGNFDLTNTNGSVEITGWDRESIDVSGTKYAPEQSDLAAIQVKVNATGNNASVTTEIPQRSWHGSYGVRYRIRVPKKIRLGRAETTNGAVTVEDLEGGGRLRSTNGKLSLSRLVGDYDLETTNGSINLEDCSGVQNAETTNGSVRGRIKQGSITARSTNGAIDLTFDRPMESKPIRVTTTNGSVTLALAEFHNNSVRAKTRNGSVTLRLPSDTNAYLAAETSMAHASSELTLTSVDEQSKHSLRGKLGSGGPEISASTSMGNIQVQRY